MSMLPPQEPIGGTEDEPVPSGRLGHGIVGPYGREAQTDSRSQADAAGMIDDQPGELDEAGWLVATQAGSLADEKAADGWIDNLLPSGGPATPISTATAPGGR